MNEIYIIFEHTGSYDTYFRDAIGFVETEEEAKQKIKSLENNIAKHPFPKIEDEEEDSNANRLHQKWEDTFYDWDEYEYDLMEGELALPSKYELGSDDFIPFYNRTPEEIEECRKLEEKRQEELKKRRLYFFQKYFKGEDIEITQDMLDDYDTYQSFGYDGEPTYSYEKVSRFTV